MAWTERWAPSIAVIVAALVALGGSFYSAQRSVDASNSTVRTVKEQFVQQNEAELAQLRRTSYIAYLTEAEKFYQAGNPDESSLRVQEAKALIVASPDVRIKVQALDKELLHPPTNQGSTDKYYLSARGEFLDAVAKEAGR